jgi:hypothetical protein
MAYTGKSLSEVISSIRGRTLTVFHIADGTKVLRSISPYRDCNGQGNYNLFDRNGIWVRNFDRFSYNAVVRSETVKRA